MSDLNRKLRWLIALRLLIVVSISAPYALYRLSTAEELTAGESAFEPMAPSSKEWDVLHILVGLSSLLETIAPSSTEGDVLRILVGLSSALTLVFITCLKLLRDRPKIHAYIQFTGDLCTITVLLYRLGDSAQSFSILYFVVISVASVLLRRSAGMIVATVAFVLFAGVTYAPAVEWLRSLEGGSVVARPVTSLGVSWGYRLSIHLIGFYAVAFLTSYLARDVALAEERLRERDLDLADLEVAHRDIVESVSAGLVTTDRNGVVTSLNRASEEILGKRAHDLVGRHVVETGLVEDDQWRLVTGSAAGRRHWELTRSVGDTSVFLGLDVTLLRDGQGTHRGYILVAEDRTDEQRLREQLRLKDRMAAIGEMAAGLAHEVGNPLAAISGSVQVLGRSLRGDGAQTKLLEIILKESQRLDRTVKSFLQLASSRQRRLAPVDVAALVHEDIELLRLSDDIHDGHRIEADLEPDSATIYADPDQIGQIFWNLARNALQAMPEGGVLRIRGRLAEPYYRLEFHDDGSGMSDEERANLFHPFKSFFDQGTGIGMAIVYRIVEEHGGRISADSQPGKGTLIRVELPIAGPPEERGAEERA